MMISFQKFVLQSQTVTTVNDNSFYVEFDRPILADTIGIGYLNCSKITVTHYDGLGNIIPEVTQVIEYSPNEDVVDYWSYIYSDYTFIRDRTQLIRITAAGIKVRLTFENKANKFQLTWLVDFYKGVDIV